MVQLAMANQLEQWSKNKVRAVIRCSNARNVLAAEIHRQFLEVYVQDVMSLAECGEIVYGISRRLCQYEGL
jgi:uncharacterized Fe-S cluster-containing radical SAM superfamily protein